MPMDFPDMKSLIQVAECHKFRPPFEGEEEHEYRTKLADHVQPIDLLESMEIRTKVGWDKFTKSNELETLFRSAMPDLDMSNIITQDEDGEYILVKQDGDNP